METGTIDTAIVVETAAHPPVEFAVWIGLIFGLMWLWAIGEVLRTEGR